ncbi:hypothetical protein [Vineibacter terrae]|uniref:hypothetical protein n=1 Tax=Vineibacter terrae TaxID=2586908 RepID=UPI002E368D50|nr:hypothetical protein [Vineibacter terrae]HEX2887782.1 hypothetical protein [Vineibacter terrae]
MATVADRVDAARGWRARIFNAIESTPWGRSARSKQSLGRSFGMQTLRVVRLLMRMPATHRPLLRSDDDDASRASTRCDALGESSAPIAAPAWL